MRIEVPDPIIDIDVELGDVRGYEEKEVSTWIAKVTVGGVVVLTRVYRHRYDVLNKYGRSEGFTDVASDEDDCRDMIAAEFGQMMKQLLDPLV